MAHWLDKIIKKQIVNTRITKKILYPEDLQEMSERENWESGRRKKNRRRRM